MQEQKPVDLYENKMQEMQEIVEKLESDTLSLSESMALFERGTELYQQAADILNQTQQKLDVLIQKADMTTIQPFDSIGNVTDYEGMEE